VFPEEIWVIPGKIIGFLNGTTILRDLLNNCGYENS
jgi:hypothetical protein